MPSILLCSPGHTIDRNGIVRKDGRPLPHCVIPAAGVVHLGVLLEEKTYFIWRLLSVTFHSNRLLLPRTGNFFEMQQDQRFELAKVSSNKITKPDEIFRIWQAYQRDGVSCQNLAEVARLPYFSVEDFRTLIGDILLSGVR